MCQEILSLSLPAYGYLYMQNISFVSNVRDLEQILGESQEAFKICCIRNSHIMGRKYQIKSESDKKIPQSHTADQPTAP